MTIELYVQNSLQRHRTQAGEQQTLGRRYFEAGAEGAYDPGTMLPPRSHSAFVPRSSSRIESVVATHPLTMAVWGKHIAQISKIRILLRCERYGASRIRHILKLRGRIDPYARTFAQWYAGQVGIYGKASSGDLFIALSSSYI